MQYACNHLKKWKQAIGNHLLHARHASEPLQKLRKEQIQLFEEKKSKKLLEVNEFIHAVKFGYKM